MTHRYLKVALAAAIVFAPASYALADDRAPTDEERAQIEQALGDQGFQLWRIKPAAPVEYAPDDAPDAPDAQPEPEDAQPQAVARTPVELAAEDLRLGEARYRTGTGSFVDLVDARTRAAQADTDLITATYEFYLALVQLELATGLNLLPDEVNQP